MPSGSFTRLTRRPAARQPNIPGAVRAGPGVAYREAYERLTGTRLPPGPPMPALPEMVTREAVDVEELLREVDLVLQELRVADAS
jgi:hypothetical protein